MAKPESKFRIRNAVQSDGIPLLNILNTIIEAGGTTAFETPLSIEEFNDHFLTGDDVLVCFVAEEVVSNHVVGFQGLSRNQDLPESWSDIWTFTKRVPNFHGAGTALFGKTAIFASDLKLTANNATIRTDNQGGIAYYEKMGFETYKVVRGVPLKDGTPIDRVSKRYLVR
jgi:hypothetical protein